MKNFKTLLISFLVFVSPLYTNAKNMETNFYYQTILDNVIPRNQNIGSEASDFVLGHIVENYQSMIIDSNLCWAACMESLIKGYKTQSKVGNEQLEIANYYIKNFVNAYAFNGNISKNKFSMTDKIAMKDHHYLSMYKKAGFNISSLSVDYLEHYKEVKKVLRNNATLIIRSMENELSHILMIIGYKNGLYYVMDPNSNARKFYYWAPKDIVVKYGIEKLWSVSVH